MAPPLPGIHHVTAIASDAQRNADFYTGVLGLRLVKRTVNYDDPGSYHLYYGDELGRPGTVLTFFVWPGAGRGRHGTGQVTATAFSVPPGSLGYWAERLAAHRVEARAPERRLGDQVLQLGDPDGLRLELVEAEPPASRPPWQAGPVPAEHAVRGFHSVTLTLAAAGDTARLLTGTLAFRAAGDEGERLRLAAAGDGPAGIVDLVEPPGDRREDGSRHAGRVALPGVTGAGTVHHVAFRTPGDQEQVGWRAEVVRAGLQTTPVVDRTYFHSIYFREPGGVLFEIATEPPGFTVDEPAGQLGSALRLPARLEPYRAELERGLPAFQVPWP